MEELKRGARSTTNSASAPVTGCLFGDVPITPFNGGPASPTARSFSFSDSTSHLVINDRIFILLALSEHS